MRVWPLNWVHRWLYRRMYFDELYHAVFVGIMMGLSRLSAWFDRHVVDGLVGGVARLVKEAAFGARETQALFGIQQGGLSEALRDDKTAVIGKTYEGRLSPRGENELEVQGCSGSLCGSEVWTRAK